jgi:hypothetical protein
VSFHEERGWSMLAHSLRACEWWKGRRGHEQEGRDPRIKIREIPSIMWERDVS